MLLTQCCFIAFQLNANNVKVQFELHAEVCLFSSGCFQQMSAVYNKQVAVVIRVSLICKQSLTMQLHSFSESLKVQRSIT